MTRHFLKLRASERGFTLPELLVTTVVIVLLLFGCAGLLRQQTFADESRNAARQLAVVQIAQALSAYHAAQGSWPSQITTKAQQIGSESGAANICSSIVPTHIADLPLDPLYSLTNETKNCADAGTVYMTGYSISKSADGAHVTVAAPYAESGERISFTK